MTSRTVTYNYTVCDGCHKNTRDDLINIVESKKTTSWAATIENTIDVCNECAEQDRYICKRCVSVHDDANPCSRVAEMIEMSTKIV